MVNENNYQRPQPIHSEQCTPLFLHRYWTLITIGATYVLVLQDDKAATIQNLLHQKEGLVGWERMGKRNYSPEERKSHQTYSKAVSIEMLQNTPFSTELLDYTSWEDTMEDLVISLLDTQWKVLYLKLILQIEDGHLRNKKRSHMGFINEGLAWLVFKMHLLILPTIHHVLSLLSSVLNSDNRRFVNVKVYRFH